MLAFGKEGVLKKDQIVNVASYVRALSGLPTGKGYNATEGARIFAEMVAGCAGRVARWEPDRDGRLR